VGYIHCGAGRRVTHPGDCGKLHSCSRNSTGLQSFDAGPVFIRADRIWLRDCFRCAGVGNGLCDPVFDIAVAQGNRGGQGATQRSGQCRVGRHRILDEALNLRLLLASVASLGGSVLVILEKNAIVAAQVDSSRQRVDGFCLGSGLAKKKPARRLAFFASNELLGGSSSVTSGGSRSSSVRSGSSRSGFRSGSSRSGFRSGSGSSSFRSGSSGFFFLATSGQAQGQEDGEQDGIFHLYVP
jgi:hypothetical protein